MFITEVKTSFLDFSSRQQLYDGEFHGGDEVGETVVGEYFPRTEGIEPQCSHHTQCNLNPQRMHYRRCHRNGQQGYQPLRQQKRYGHQQVK